MSSIIEGMTKDLKTLPKRLKTKAEGADTKKLVLLNLPYVLAGYFCNKTAYLWRMAEGSNASDKMMAVMSGMDKMFSNPLPSFFMKDLLIGIVGGVLLKLVVYYKAKNAKNFRHGVEYGSARWGNAKDIEPYMDSVFENNILLTATERLMMSGRPKEPKYARNKNILVIGGSGSGKTRFFVKPNLMQMHSSYVVTDPKGTVLVECGKMLKRGKYKIKVLNTINFAKSMHYNPFAYLRSEKDILKLVNTIIVNTKGEGQQSGEDFWVKAEKLYYTALIAYIWYEAPEEEQNFAMLIDLIDASEAREDDENFKNAVDLLFEELEEKDPNHFAVRQYKKYKLAAGDINALQKSDSKDEIADLTNSLINLAHTRKQSSDQAKGEKIKVETILQNMNDGIIAFDLKGNLIHFNREAKKLLNRQYLDDIRFDRFFKEINANITLGDLLYMNPDGSVEREIKLANQYLRLNFAPFKADNKVGGIIVVIHDVTKQEKLEQSRRDFVANVSHELRTPLTTIKSYSETLADMPDVDRELQVRFLDVIASESDRMARIISDLLTLSELDENQTFTKPPEPIDIRQMLESIVERMSLTAKKKNQTLTYHPINEVPVISGDHDGLERVIINIVSNAMKYTREGGTIEVYSSKVYNDICIKVADNGIGIQEDKLPHIFDRFYRVDKARSRDTGGTGLGLAIAKQTLESSFNGKIKISSEFHKGTEVTITIPVSE